VESALLLVAVVTSPEGIIKRIKEDVNSEGKDGPISNSLVEGTEIEARKTPSNAIPKP